MSHRLHRPRNPDSPGNVSVGLAILLALAGAFVVARCSIASGQAPAPLHVLLARSCANESTRVLRPARDGGTDGAMDDDCRGIVETAHAFAAWKGVTVEAAIRRLSPHVAGGRAPKNPRHAAFAALPARGAAKPPQWDESALGPWRIYGPRWQLLREAVRAYVPTRECDSIAWGGSMDVERALARGLVRVDCWPLAQNGFWALPPERVLAASVAGGGR